MIVLACSSNGLRFCACLACHASAALRKVLIASRVAVRACMTGTA